MSLSQGGHPENVKVPYPIVRCPAQKAFAFECMTRCWVDLLTHYWGGRTIACTQTEDCKACLAGTAQVWQGFLLGKSSQTAEKVLVALTAVAAHDLGSLIWRQQSLWGAEVWLTRIGHRRNSPLNATIRGWQDDTPFLAVDHLEHCVKTVFKLHGLGTVLKA